MDSQKFQQPNRTLDQPRPSFEIFIRQNTIGSFLYRKLANTILLLISFTCTALTLFLTQHRPSLIVPNMPSPCDCSTARFDTRPGSAKPLAPRQVVWIWHSINSCVPHYGNCQMTLRGLDGFWLSPVLQGHKSCPCSASNIWSLQETKPATKAGFYSLHTLTGWRRCNLTIWTRDVMTCYQ